MALRFTKRELTNAWRDLVKASRPSGCTQCPTNAHRLLLFYAVECGLKAVLLKNWGKTVFCKDDVKNGHDLRELQKQLRLSNDALLPNAIQVGNIRIDAKKEEPRNGGVSALHEVWRYGGVCQSPTDEECEKKLSSVSEWIAGELK
jgi:hypothetical protein